MAQIKTFTCRFQPMRRANLRGWATMKEYLVPVSWWAYDDDRLETALDWVSRVERVEALVSVKAHDLREARKLVVKEWGNYGHVGAAVKQEVAA